MARVVKPVPSPIEQLVQRIKDLQAQNSKLLHIKSASAAVTVDGV